MYCICRDWNIISDRYSQPVTTALVMAAKAVRGDIILTAGYCIISRYIYVRLMAVYSRLCLKKLDRKRFIAIFRIEITIPLTKKSKEFIQKALNIFTSVLHNLVL